MGAPNLTPQLQVYMQHEEPDPRSGWAFALNHFGVAVEMVLGETHGQEDYRLHQAANPGWQG